MRTPIFIIMLVVFNLDIFSQSSTIFQTKVADPYCNEEVFAPTVQLETAMIEAFSDTNAILDRRYFNVVS
jgi:hypothetical protein